MIAFSSAYSISHQRMPALQSPTFVYRCLKAGLKHSPNLQVFKLGSHCYTQPLAQKAEREKPLLLGCLNWIPRVASSLWHSRISLVLTILQMTGQEDLHLHIKQHSFQAELREEWIQMYSNKPNLLLFNPGSSASNKYLPSWNYSAKASAERSREKGCQ